MTSSGKYVKMPDERSTHVSNLLLCNALASIPAIFTREITREFLGPRTVSNCLWLRRFRKIADADWLPKSRLLGFASFSLTCQFFYSSPPTFTLILDKLFAQSFSSLNDYLFFVLYFYSDFHYSSFSLSLFLFLYIYIFIVKLFLKIMCFTIKK